MLFGDADFDASACGWGHSNRELPKSGETRNPRPSPHQTGHTHLEYIWRYTYSTFGAIGGTTLLGMKKGFN